MAKAKLQRAGKSQRATAQLEMKAELSRQMSDVTTLLIRIFKAMHFTDSQILEAAEAACKREAPRPVRYPTPGRGELWGNVLCRWMEDPRFVGEDGQPKVIPIRGSSISFSALVQESLPGVDVAECLDGLLKMDSVVKVQPAKVKLRSSATLYSGRKETFVEGVLLSVRELLRTVAWNLTDQEGSGRPKLFQRGVTGVEISEEDMDELLRMLSTQGMTLLESVNGWVNRRALDNSKSATRRSRPRVRPYIGIYVSDGSGATSSNPCSAQK